MIILKLCFKKVFFVGRTSSPEEQVKDPSKGRGQWWPQASPVCRLRAAGGCRQTCPAPGQLPESCSSVPTTQLAFISAVRHWMLPFSPAMLLNFILMKCHLSKTCRFSLPVFFNLSYLLHCQFLLPAASQLQLHSQRQVCYWELKTDHTILILIFSHYTRESIPMTSHYFVWCSDVLTFSAGFWTFLQIHLFPNTVF